MNIVSLLAQTEYACFTVKFPVADGHWLVALVLALDVLNAIISGCLTPL